MNTQTSDADYRCEEEPIQTMVAIDMENNKGAEFPQELIEDIGVRVQDAYAGRGTEQMEGVNGCEIIFHGLPKDHAMCGGYYIEKSTGTVLAEASYLLQKRSNEWVLRDKTVREV